MKNTIFTHCDEPVAAALRRITDGWISIGNVSHQTTMDLRDVCIDYQSRNAELEAALEDALELIKHGDFSNGVTGGTSEMDEGDCRASQAICELGEVLKRNALPMCPSCNGSRLNPNSLSIPCWYCDGTGRDTVSMYKLTDRK